MTNCHQLKLSATDGKSYFTDVADIAQILQLIRLIPSKNAEQFRKCVDWEKINKYDYLAAMEKSVSSSDDIKKLLFDALTDKIDDREMFMKGIDHSYYYEESDS